jgi:hypothetical protein
VVLFAGVVCWVDCITIITGGRRDGWKKSPLRVRIRYFARGRNSKEGQENYRHVTGNLTKISEFSIN